MTLIHGYELVVGDAIEWLAREYEITSFEEHRGLRADGLYMPARVAASESNRDYFDDWKMTVFDDDTYKVEVGTKPGTRVVRLHN